MAMDRSQHGDGDYGMRESTGVPAAVIWLALAGLLVVFSVGGYTAFNSSTNLLWPASNTLTIPLSQ